MLMDIGRDVATHVTQVPPDGESRIEASFIIQ
jgi:hypothetical protein